MLTLDRRAPRTIASPTRDVEVGAMEGFGPAAVAFDALAWVTGPCIRPGTCNNCHIVTPKYIEEAPPAFRCTSQILTKLAIMAAAGAGGWLYGGWLYALGGAVVGNLAARPLVNAIATASGPEPDTTGVK